MKCKDTQKKQYANFYFIFLLFSFRQILITRPYCHLPTLFLSRSSTPQPFTPSLPPFSHLFSHDPNPLLHCFSPRPPLFFSPNSILLRSNHFSPFPNLYCPSFKTPQLSHILYPHIQSQHSVSYRSQWSFRSVLFSRFLTFQFQLPSAAPFLRSSFAVASLTIHPL